MSKKDEALKLALEALELAQDNLRDHGDNCFLHDEGEYSRCFCGKDSLSDHLQSVVEKLDEALAQPEQEPVIDKSAAVRIATALGWEPKRKPLTVDEVWQNDQLMALNAELGCGLDLLMEVVEAIEAAHGIKE